MKYTSVILFALIFGSAVLAQQQAAPEKTVSGFSLLESEDAARAALQGYSPRFETENALPKYFFYNEYGNQVLALTAASRERPYLIVGIEVFGVDETYRKSHYQLKSIAAFTSESGFFLGARPSAGSLIFGVPNVTGAKDVIKKKGAPASDQKNGKTRTLRYETKSGAATYRAEYEFYKNRLNRFSITAESK